MAGAASIGDMCGSQDVTIRRAKRADARLIHELVRALARSLGAARKVTAVAADFEREGFGAEPVFDALIAERGPDAVGLCLYFDSFSSWDGRRGIYVQDLFVSECARGTGLGRRLLAEAAAIARARGGSYLRLSVNVQNTAAQRFYEQAGLDRSATERIFQVREDAFVDLAERAEGCQP